MARGLRRARTESALAAIADGKPTLSAVGDDLVRSIVARLSAGELEAFDLELESWVARSSGWSTWVQQESGYLADVDPGAVDAIMISLTSYDEVLRARAATDD